MKVHVTKKEIKSLEFHVESNDFFGTYATIINCVKDKINPCAHKKEREVLDNMVHAFMYLQQNDYKIVKDK